MLSTVRSMEQDHKKMVSKLVIWQCISILKGYDNHI